MQGYISATLSIIDYASYSQKLIPYNFIHCIS